MPEPRLIQIAEFDRPHGGSFVPLLEGLLAAARDAGWRALAVLPEKAGETPWIDGLRSVADVRLAPPDALRSRRSRHRWLRETIEPTAGRTVMHTHFTAWDVAALLVARQSRAPTSVFWHTHSALPRDPAVVLRSAVKFGVLGRAVAGIICPAPNIALGVEQRLGSRERVHFVPSALDPSLYPLASEADRARARKELDVPAEAEVLLHFGWHPYLKGTDIFLGVVRDLVAAGRPVHAIVRGHEPVSVEVARELGIDSRVRFQPPVPDASTLFAAADVVVSSSREEGMAYTVLEALSTGTPVVATAIPGHAYIGEQVEACRITSIRPDSLRRAIGAVLDDDSEVKAAQGEAAHDWIVDNLSVAAISEQLMSLYRRELPTSSPGPSPRERTARRRTATPRVVQVADYANAGGGSFIPMLAAACGAVSERGWRAEVVLPELAAGSPWLEPLEESGAEVRFAPEVGRDGIRRWLRDTAEDEGGSTIHHCHFTSFDVSAALAAVGVRGSHTVWHVHSALSSDPAVIARNLVKFGAVSRFVSAIVCPAPDLGRALQRRGVPASRLAFVPNAIDIARFAPAGTEEREAARRDLDLPTSGPIALGFGWDWEIKSAELFLRAAHAATERSQDLHAVLITEDERGNDLRAELRMDGAMTFLEPVTDVRPLLAASDVFVAASAAEGGTPLAVLEALASGVPVVASDIPAHRYIAERSRGVVLSARETTEMGTAIAGVVNAAEPVGTELAAEFGLDRWSAQILDIYEAIV